jgi:hypothetical protein
VTNGLTTANDTDRTIPEEFAGPEQAVNCGDAHRKELKMTAGHTPRLSRRLLRLNVRALMLVVVVTALTMAWVVRSAWIRRRAVAALCSSGCGVIYHSEGQAYETGEAPRWPGWLEEFVGIDCLDHVDDVILDSSGTDRELAYVSDLSRLRSITVFGSSVSDVGMCNLRSMKTLARVRGPVG